VEKIEGRSDPENYRKLSEPHENVDCLNWAVNSFMDEVYELRNKYCLTDVHIIMKNSVIVDGKEQHAMSSGHFGDSMKAEQMTAWGFGKAREDKDAILATLMSQENVVVEDDE